MEVMAEDHTAHHLMVVKAEAEVVVDMEVMEEMEGELL